jgi:hypothetical protein
MYTIVILSFSIIHCGFRSSLICDFSLPFVVFSIFLKQYFKISSDTLHDNFVDDFIKLQCIISNKPHRPFGGVLVVFCVVVFVLLVLCPLFPVFLDCPFVIASSVFSNVYILLIVF